MGVLSAIVAIANAIPELIKLVEQIGPELKSLIGSLTVWIKHVSGDDAQGYIKKVGEAVSQLQIAKTVEEREVAAKAIADVLKGLP